MSVLELKQEYNTVLTRQYKGAIYLDDEGKPLADRLKWSLEYKKVVDRLEVLIEELRAAGMKMTQDEILGGFHID